MDEILRDITIGLFGMAVFTTAIGGAIALGQWLYDLYIRRRAERSLRKPRDLSDRVVYRKPGE